MQRRVCHTPGTQPEKHYTVPYDKTMNTTDTLLQRLKLTQGYLSLTT